MEIYLNKYQSAMLHQVVRNMNKLMKQHDPKIEMILILLRHFMFFKEYHYSHFLFSYKILYSLNDYAIH